MPNRVEIIGVHPVAADEPVHLIEIEIEESSDPFDFGAVTQEIPGRPSANWQVAYDERELGRAGGRVRFAFFFHYLDPKKPLRTSFGAVNLARATPMPAHLDGIEYEAP
jgi:hypothetical protein